MAENENKELDTELEKPSEVITETKEETAVVDSKSKKKSKPEAKKPNMFKRLFGKLKKGFNNMKSELKKVTWFSRKQTFSSTLLVLVCIGIAALVIGLLDYGFSKGIEGLAELYNYIYRLVTRR